MKNIPQRPIDPVNIEGQTEVRILLLLDDNPGVAMMLRRVLLQHFDYVFVASGPSSATSILERTTVTHIISDQNFGKNEILGSTFLFSWRHRFPSVRRAVIFTGAGPSTVPRSEEIDAVLHKTATPEELVMALELEGDKI